jgi:flagellar hook-associated protein 2
MMALTLDSMTSIAMLKQTAGYSAPTADSQVTGAFALASQRITQKIDSTNVQLSAFGQINSGFANVQSASKVLVTPPKNSTSADVVNAVQNFAKAYNTATTAVSTAVNGTANEKGALANNYQARFAGSDLKSVLANSTNVTDLSKIGVSVNKDGTLAVDTKVLQASIQANPDAVNATLAKIGQQAGQVTTKDLSKTGNVGGSVNMLSGTSKTLQAQAAEQQQMFSNSQLIVQQQSAAIGNVSSSIAAYMQIFSS